MSGSTFGILCALPEELGGLVARVDRRRPASGLELLEVRLDERAALACVGGVGKVRAAHAAAVLAAEGVDSLLVVGVCGGLTASLAPGALVHAEVALQADLGLRGHGRTEADPLLRGAWEEVAPGRRGTLVTRDRAAVMPWRRLFLARRHGALGVDMETAAAGFVADRAGLPWAALRAVTDGLWRGGTLAFRRHFPAQAGRAADTVPDLSRRLARGEPPARG